MAQQASHGLQSVDYRYNIRGWLDRINKSDLGAESTPELADYFGMHIDYTSTVAGMSNTAWFNGNISAMRWSVNLGLADTTFSEVKEQGYSMGYDALNRLTAATHKKKSTGWGTSNSLHENGITYDRNGNIKTLQRQDHMNQALDNLAYTYEGTDGNKLLKVSDAANDGRGFKDGANGTDDYAYDANGNLRQDLNKNIPVNGIEYNHLDLPKKVTVSGVGYFIYTYDAAGTKLREEFFNPGGASQWYMDYDGEFVYKNNTLQLIHHEQGRYLPGGEYQYVLTDHLGNTRVTFTTRPKVDVHTAGYEDANSTYEANTFNPSYSQALRLSGNGHNSTKAQRLSASSQSEIIGLSKGLKVLPGDVVDLEVYARYVHVNGSSSNAAALIFAAMAGSFGVNSSSTGEGGMLYDALSAMNGAGTLLNSGSGVDATKPKAYLNYIMFDENYIPYDFGFDQVSVAAENSWEKLVLQAKPRKVGYVYIYLSNENGTIIDTFFDNLKITHTHSPVIQAVDYYPFGMVAHDYLMGGALLNRYLYQGKERMDSLGWDDFHARWYSGETGRFLSVDPAGQFASGYVGMGNNPVMMVDPSGKIAFSQVLGLAMTGYSFFQDYKQNGFNYAVDNLATNFAFNILGGVGGGYQPTNVANGIAHNALGTFIQGAGSGQSFGQMIPGMAVSGAMGAIDGGMRQQSFKRWQNKEYFNWKMNGGSGTYRLPRGRIFLGPLQMEMLAEQNLDPLKMHFDESVSLEEFLGAVEGKTYDEVINQLRDRSMTSAGSQPGGPEFRYVRNPHDGNVIDMRHMLVVGYQFGTTLGSFLEVAQWMRGLPSGMDQQDFYSNRLGAEFMNRWMINNVVSPRTFSSNLGAFFNKKRDYNHGWGIQH